MQGGRTCSAQGLCLSRAASLGFRMVKGEGPIGTEDQRELDLIIRIG